MRRIYDPSLKATITLDDSGQVCGINYVDEYREMEGLRGRDAAIAYFHDIANTLNIPAEQLRRMEQRVSYIDPHPQDVEYRFSKEKPSFHSATYTFYQTYLNTPVWAAGVTATIKQAPARVVAVTNTSERGIDATMPSSEAIKRYRDLFATGEKIDGPRRRATAVELEPFSGTSSELLVHILGQAGNASNALDDLQGALRLIRGRFFVYRYDPARRAAEHKHATPNTHEPQAGTTQDLDQPLCGTAPTLPLPPVPKSIQEGRWYLVAELVFRLPHEGSRMNWRMLVEVETNAILYLRALSSGVIGKVFTYDPITSTGMTTNTPDRGNDVLNDFRDDVVLDNLNPPVAGTQSLQGTLATLSEEEDPLIAPPTRPDGSDFIYDVRTNDFAAVNAYYHTDRFFQLVENLGFPLATYFDGTAFPVEVDHRGLDDPRDPLDMGNTINAHCVGDGDGIDHTCYALADLTDTVNPIGIATDWRVVLHELGGHGTLDDHVGSPNFRFAHSAGDSFAMILNDYLSEWHNGAPLDRFVLAPFVPAVRRRSDRDVADGWGWGGVHDTGINIAALNFGYLSEQILSTTMFRAYRAIGGDSSHIVIREIAARVMAYLMLQALVTLDGMSNPRSPTQYLDALLAADTEDWTSEGFSGGAYGKVLTWAFEKQNLNHGAPPALDVYIDDGRGGEYDYLPNYGATTTIWNRRNPDGMPDHQEPALEETNYVYVKIKNRGTSIANDIIVKGYHCRPSAGLRWPTDLQPFTTPELSAGTLLPNNTEEKIVGPFEWTPVTNAWGHDCIMMFVSATGDPTNVANFTAGDSIEDWRLVPNDNNVAQRNVNPVPGGGGVRGLMAGLHGKGFWVGNPGRSAATIAASVALPPLLASRGWRIGVRDLPARGARLKAGEHRLVTFDVHPGAPFTKAEVMATTERDIIVTATADGGNIGGMVYQIDPEIEMPFNDSTPEDRKEGCRDKAKQLLDCLNVPGSKVKHVCVRKVSIDVKMEGDCACD